MADLIDAAALVVSAVALGTSIVALKQDAKERRLAATPQLVFDRWTNLRDRSLEITVTNRGLGPARIAGFSIMLDGVARPLRNEAQVQSLADDLRIAAVFEKVAELAIGAMIAPGQTMPIINLSNIVVADGGDLRATLRRLSVAIQYRSLYDELRPIENADDNDA